jgi:hypothetical protein
MSLRPGLAPSPEGRDRRRSAPPVGRGHALPTLDDARRDAAREAWRQFARASGARRRGHRSDARGMSWLWLAAFAAAVVVWLVSDTTPEPASTQPAAPDMASVDALAAPPEPATIATQTPPTADEPLVDVGAIPWPRRVASDPNAPDVSTSQPDSTNEAPASPDEAPASPPAVRANPRLAPRTPAPRASDGWSGPTNPRAAPPGTPDANADALRKLPVARADKPPVAGVGALGIHVDYIAVGSIYDSGKCSGHEKTGFSASRKDRVSACFRVVHPRTTQQVNVIWSRDDEVMRRTKMTIPSAHAYRTRAFIVLRDGDAGRWSVRVLSSDDVELARARFDVDE